MIWEGMACIWCEHTAGCSVSFTRHDTGRQLQAQLRHPRGRACVCFVGSAAPKVIFSTYSSTDSPSGQAEAALRHSDLEFSQCCRSGRQLKRCLQSWRGVRYCSAAG